ncbi:MAG TPA: flagellar basal body rod protein FlgB [Methylophilaceae bacterium]|nr:flagellar basal body rod protein FlgB [Methylophilaceae bacterium]
MIDKLDAALNFHQTALRLRAERQELIAANIANADTPNYKARDLDFGAALKQALTADNTAQAGDGITPAMTSAGHLPGVAITNAAANGPLSTNVLYRPVIQGSADGNSVDMDVERNQFADNAVRYETSLTLINGQIKRMLAAIQG